MLAFPSSFCSPKEGFPVRGIDIDNKKVRALNQGEFYVYRVPKTEIQPACRRGFSATFDFACIAETDAIVICVPTLEFTLHQRWNRLPHLVGAAIDPFYPSWKAQQRDFQMRFIELAGEINAAMPRHVVESVGAALNRTRKPINGSRILVLGVPYKKDIDDLRESPALIIIGLLRGTRRRRQLP